MMFHELVKHKLTFRAFASMTPLKLSFDFNKILLEWFCELDIKNQQLISPKVVSVI